MQSAPTFGGGGGGGGLHIKQGRRPLARSFVVGRARKLEMKEGAAAATALRAEHFHNLMNRE